MSQVMQQSGKHFSVAGNRRAGILLHPSSLPGASGNGDLGPEAYRFVEFLAAAGLTVWQTLPLGPTHEDGSPYQCLSVHAGNPRLISLSWLQDKGWLQKKDVPVTGGAKQGDCLERAYQQFLKQADTEAQNRFAAFKSEQAAWLDDYALFRVIRELQQNRPWTEWPNLLRDRQTQALAKIQKAHKNALECVSFSQFVFFEQWQALREYAHSHGVLLFGDMPIFVAHDSADVWAQREYFRLDRNGQPQVVAGVPPDYFSATGQRWGNPHYDWTRMQADSFQWWIARMHSQLAVFDVVRIDHFRGFEAYWEIPAEAETAMSGHWVKAPGEALLKALYKEFGDLPLVAEDLGIITPEVEALRRQFELPGMKILQFAFSGGADNPYLPHNHELLSVVYTGTHDNDTTLGWFSSLPDEQRKHLQAYLGYPIAESMPWPLVRCALASVAELAVIPMQDVLELGEGQRMNTPGTSEGNWQWRFSWEQVPLNLAERLRTLLALYGRIVE